MQVYFQTPKNDFKKKRNKLPIIKFSRYNEIIA